MELDETTREFIAKHPTDCSYIPVRLWQIVWYCLVVAVVIFSVAWRWDILLYAVNFFFAFLYFSIILFRGAAVGLSLLGFGKTKVTPAQLAELEDADLPMYSILVPLYREAKITDKIIASLEKLDYPKDKLDIKLLLEADDEATITAVERLGLPDRYDVIIVPDALPKTKPKACNHGLNRAKGEFCVIYDAEDRPEPDQLKKAVCVFRRLPPTVACLQAKLNYYNARQNLLTRWFTIEYSTYFDLFLPGLQIMRVPVPLGGTSNHFRIGVLKEIGGWDPFNVTEDCDLGVRIYEQGCRTRMLDSTTWEEANSRLWNWLRQRSRWIKGFFQTHLTHMQRPFRTLRHLGPWGFFGFLMSVGGSSFMMVMNVIYWLAGGLYLGLLSCGVLAGHGPLEFIIQGPGKKALPFVTAIKGLEVRAWPLVYYGPKEDPFWSTLSVIFFVITCTLLLANLLFVLMHCAACCKRRNFHLLPYALFMPLYWVLISIGAWKGLWQLFTKPFYWEKTIHGLDHRK